MVVLYPACTCGRFNIPLVPAVVFYPACTCGHFNIPLVLAVDLVPATAPLCLLGENKRMCVSQYLCLSVCLSVCLSFFFASLLFGCGFCGMVNISINSRQKNWKNKTLGSQQNFSTGWAQYQIIVFQ